MSKSNFLLTLAVASVLAAPVAHADDMPSTTVSGLFFIDLTGISTTQDAPVVPLGAKPAAKTGDIDPSGIGLDVKRGYLIVNHSFDDVWSAYLNTDFNYASYKASSSVSGGVPGETVNTSVTTPETQLFIKKLYLQGRFDQWAVLRVGSADMPWTGYVEGLYGYRFVENTMTDRSGFANTADWGVNMNGADGLFNYSASIVNGNGYKNPSRSKGMDEEFRLGLTPLDGALVIGVGGYFGHRGQDTETTPAVHTASREDLLVGWKAAGLTLGGEWFIADDWNDVLNAGTTTKSEGLSLFGSYDFPGTAFSVFARHDQVKPAKDTFSQLKDEYSNLGVAWKYNANLTWAVAYKNDKLTDNLKYNLGSDDLKTEELGIWAQIKF
ncbi:MAG TPA: carbohydrate porin [Gammaproteobacteria bacterium]